MGNPETIETARKLAGRIGLLADSLGSPIRFMEVCGTHTVAIFKSGLRSLLPPDIKLLSGPGCPVCVTSVTDVDGAIAMSGLEGVVMTTFGDMMRVPGSQSSLLTEKAKGADIRIVYSPLDALPLAKANPDKKIIFFATGFETTSPSVAATAVEAMRLGVKNFFIYPVHKLVPPALRALLSSSDVKPDVKIDGLILPGHVSAIIGTGPYEFLASEFKTPAVIAGFEPVDILQAIYMLLMQIERCAPQVENQYRLVVRDEGNPKAVGLMEEVFEPSDADWRGIGIIPGSGLKLREKFSGLDAGLNIPVDIPSPIGPKPHDKGCRCGSVMRGVIAPTDCPLFGRACTPEHPVGACMVSTEGSCAAYYKYGGEGSG